MDGPGVWLGCAHLFFFLPVYCNSLLATLNVRNAIRGRGHGDLGISLGPISDSHTSTTSNSKVIGLVVPLVLSRRSPIRWHRKSASSQRPWGMTSKMEDTEGMPMPTITIDVHRSSSQYPRTAPGSSRVNPTLSSPSPTPEKYEF